MSFQQSIEMKLKDNKKGKPYWLSEQSYYTSINFTITYSNSSLAEFLIRPARANSTYGN